MILVLAGTKDGRELAWALAEAGYKVVVSALTSYGGAVAGHVRLDVVTGPMDIEDMLAFIGAKGINAVVDASHPYAVNVTYNAQQACLRTNTIYIRYERPATPLIPYERLHTVSSAAEAAKLAGTLGKTVFLTTGSRTLAVFAREPQLKDCRLIARVLPEPAVITQCIELGFSPQNIIAMQGPFSRSLNAELYRHFKADVVITKNSGEVGGTQEKIEAAIDLGISVIVIERPTVHNGCAENIASSFDEVLGKLAICCKSGGL